MKMRTCLGILGALGILVAFAPSAHADSITFSSATAGGFVYYNGTATGVLTGTKVPILILGDTNSTTTYAVTGNKCGSAGSSYACGLLTFTTGTLISSTTTTRVFNGGGSLTISGTVPGGTGLVTLVSATFVGNVTMTNLGGGVWQVSGNIQVNAIDPTVLALYPGLIVPSTAGLTNTLNLKFIGNQSGAIGGVSQSTQVMVTGAAPEPATLVLLGGGLLGLSAMVRRRRSRQ